MKHGTVAGLDIGTTKTCAVVASDGPQGLEIIGYGEAPSLGMRKGVVTDLEETIKSIEAATEKAEQGEHEDDDQDDPEDAHVLLLCDRLVL